MRSWATLFCTVSGNPGLATVEINPVCDLQSHDDQVMTFYCLALCLTSVALGILGHFIQAQKAKYYDGPKMKSTSGLF